MKLNQFDNPLTGKSERLDGETVIRYVIGSIVVVGGIMLAVWAVSTAAAKSGLSKLGIGVPGSLVPQQAHSATAASSLTVLQ